MSRGRPKKTLADIARARPLKPEAWEHKQCVPSRSKPHIRYAHYIEQRTPLPLSAPGLEALVRWSGEHSK